jgi:hypothetical protein
VVGVVLILLAMFVIGPILIFAGGAIWSAITGWLLAEDADREPAPAPNADG